MLLTRSGIRRHEELTVRCDAIGGAKGDGGRYHQCRGRKVSGHRFRSQCLPHAAIEHCGVRRHACVTHQRNDRSLARFDRVPCNARLGQRRDWCRSPIGCHRHHATTVDIADVRVVEHARAVLAQRDELHLAIAGSQIRWRAAGRSDAPEMHPSGALPRKHDLITGGPLQLVVGNDGPIGAAASSCRPKDFPRAAARDIGHHDAPGLRGARRAKSEILS